MSAIILFVGIGLIGNWVSRTMPLLLWWGRKLMAALRIMFIPPTDFVG